MTTLSEAFGGTLGNWSASNGGTIPAITGGQLSAGAAADYREMAYTASSFATANYFHQIESAVTEAVSVVNLLSRMSGLTGSRNGYIGQFNKISGLYRILRVDAGFETLLASATIGTIGSSEALYFSVSGPNLELRKAGVSVLTATDSTYTTGGTPGIGIYADTDAVRLDNWTGQDAATGALLAGRFGGGTQRQNGNMVG